MSAIGAIGPWRHTVTVAFALVVLVAAPRRASAQEVPVGRAAVESLTFEPLTFEPPAVEDRSVLGVDVLLLQDPSLPLVTVQAYFRGGYGRFPRADYAAGMGLPAMLRYGGTRSRTPAEVDEELAFHAHQLSFGSAGGSVTSSIDVLDRHLERGLDLWAEMLGQPRFDAGEIARWRDRELESVRRRADDPARLAYSELNLLLFGDHPVGWEMDEQDLAPERVSPERFHAIHRRVICRDNLVLGVSGRVEWSALQRELERFVERIAPCTEALPPEPVPEIAEPRGVHLIEKEIDQAVIAMAHPSTVRLADAPEYFSAMIGNSILGGGGFSSRLMSRVRTEEGFAYSVGSLWTTPRTHDGLVGATTRTRPGNVAAAIGAILETMEGLRDSAPRASEVETTVDQIVNGFVFNFDTPSRIVSRRMFYRAQDFPEDWLDRYMAGVQRVTPESVREVFEAQLEPERMTILVVGDPSRMDMDALATFGPIRRIEVR